MMDDDTKRVLQEAGAKAMKEQRKAKGLPEYPTDPVVIQRCAELLRIAAQRIAEDEAP